MQQDFAAIWLQYYNHKTAMQAEMIFYKMIKLYLVSISITILLWYYYVKVFSKVELRNM